MLRAECWKPIPEYPEYEASSLGNIRKNGKLKKLSKTRSGYLVTGIGYEVRYVHRLVASAFHGASVLDVNHKDGIKTNNNNPDNLEWATRQENIRHAFDTGLNKSNKILTEAQEDAVLAYSELYGMTQKTIARMYGVNPSTISRALKNAKEKYSVAR